MSKTYKLHGFFSLLKYEALDYFRQNRVKVIAFIFIILISVLTGILTAIKFEYEGSLVTFQDYGLAEYSYGILGSFQLFLSRFFSIVIVLTMLTICASTVYLNFIGYIIIAYRAYLVGLNICLMITMFGISGILTALLIILPCQLLTLVIMSAYFIISSRMSIVNKKYGACKKGDRGKLFIITLLILVLINVLETLLLICFNSSVILVI